MSIKNPLPSILNNLRDTLFNSRIQDDIKKNNTVRYYDIEFPNRAPIISIEITKAIKEWKYERTNLKIFDNFIEKGDRILDLGMGIGLHPIYCARFPNVEQVMYIDPNPYITTYVEGLKELNEIKNVHVVNATLSTQDDPQSSFYLREDFYSSSTISTPDYKQKFDIQTISIHDVIQDFKPTLISYFDDEIDFDLLPYINSSKVKIIKKKRATEEFIISKNILIPFNKEILTEKIEKVLRNEKYEELEFQQLRDIIQPGERILEIGAGIGFISTHCAKNKKVEKILAIEANPNLIPFIKEIHHLNNVQNVEIISGVLMTNPTAKETNFYLRSEFWASSLSPVYQHYKSIKVPVFGFNNVVKEFKPTLIICDIEGGEVDLFQKAHLQLNKVEKVYLEVHQERIGRKGMLSLFNAFHRKNFHYDEFHSSRSVVLFSNVQREKLFKERIEKNKYLTKDKPAEKNQNERNIRQEKD